MAGAVLTSRRVNEELTNHPEITTVSLGYFELKNIEQAVEIFAIAHDEIPTPTRSELKGKRQKITKSIAVLPFVNMSTSEENEYLAMGLPKK